MSERARPFGFLDRDAEFAVRSRNLPHWSQAGAATFITFRTRDSLPQEVLLRWRRELEQWLDTQGLPLSLGQAIVSGCRDERERLLRELSVAQRSAINTVTDRIWHGCLDECHGQCLLRRPDVAEIVAQALHHYDCEKYDLDRFVVMPNHVHVIAQFYDETALGAVGQSWMRYTAREINALTGRSGRFWQPEAFDHIIRSPEQFQHLQAYVENNPVKAKLKPGSYLFWSRG